MRSRSFVGRGRELEELASAIDDAQHGRGSLWLVTGEPGIGKSRLLEEVARGAADRDVNVLWGRCWEAGGAPAYWPFIQVLRALQRVSVDAEASLAPYAIELAELLPELRASVQARGSSPLPPEQARFRLMDAVARGLCDASSHAPLLLLLEDLHAADPSSVLLLDFLSQLLRDAKLLVIGSYREADAQRSPAGALLARLAGTHPRLALERLGREQIEQYLEQALGKPPDAALSAAVFATTEGNPLFVGELARLHARGQAGGAAARGTALPTGIRTAIRSRLQLLRADTRELLAMAAVVGRECRSALLAAIAERSADAIARAVDEATEAEVLVETAPGQLRFSHILLQQVLYAELEPARRCALHVRVAAELLRDNVDPTGTERAHHLLAAGPEVAAEAAAAACAAARAASEQHALAEAAALYQRALAALALTQHAPVERCDLLLELGRARILAHELEEGRAVCAEAAALARSLGDAERFARAALAQGAVYVIAEVHGGLVALLSEALELLGERDHPLRARVMARLAAAQQPAADPQQPIALAHEAVALARRLGDRATLLATIDAAISTMMDLAPAADVLPLVLEQAELAAALGAKADAFRAYLRLSVTAYVLGDAQRAQRAIGHCQQLADELGQPHYQWRAAAQQAMRATWLGEFAAAERHSLRARELGARASDPNAEGTYALQRCIWLRMQGRFDGVREAIETLARFAPGGAFGQAAVAVSLAGELAWARRSADEVRSAFEPARAFVDALVHDTSMPDYLTEIALVLGDRELLERVYATSSAHAHELSSHGVFGLTWDQPVQRRLARAAWGLGRLEQADQHYEAAQQALRALGARPLLAWCAFEHGELLAARGEVERAAQRLDEARSAAAALGIALPERTMPEASQPAKASAKERGTSAGTGVPEVGDLQLKREGEYWTVQCDGRSFRLKDGKGVTWLAQLVAEAGRELHVLDLVSPDGAVDRGDGGELLDGQARAAYQARVRELRDELEEAERFADSGRAQRLRAELDAIAEQLASAIGLGGRGRRSGAAVERARVNVQRRLRDTLARIASHDPALGRHLEWALKTGTYCSYRLRA
ncbi:MAG TPA: AAA family ATPase [Polyangiales bacterium]|nr:AAA family ATPase [Polyangiales bacterium]